jgi:4-hydroxybenzoate polyprenyltransferase
MVKIKAILSLVRWPNLIIIAATMLVSFFALQGQEIQLSSLDLNGLIMITLSVLFIAAAGNVINDVQDYEIDLINKPDKVIIEKHLSKYGANVLYVILNVLALMLSALVGAKTQFEGGFYIIPMMIGLLYLYSMYFKKMPLIGNVVVALLSASAIVIPHWFNNQSFDYEDQIIAYLYFAFALILSLVREIVKDIEDIEGDKAQGAKTLPILVGLKASKGIAIGGLITLVIILFNLQLFFKSFFEIELAEMLVITPINSIIFLLGFNIYRAKHKQDYHKISILCKIVMVLGILSMLLFLS